MKTVKDYNFTKRHYLGEIYEQRLCILYEHWYLKDQTQTFNFLFKFFEMSLTKKALESLCVGFDKVAS